MRKSSFKRKLWLWGVSALLGAISIAIIGLVDLGPPGYRPYYAFAVLLRDPLDLHFLKPEFYRSLPSGRGRSVLICPANICGAANNADVESPIFNVPAGTLVELLDQIILAEPGAAPAYLPPGNDLLRRYILHRPPLGLPETIDLMVVPIDATQATFALYARDLIRELAPERSERTAAWLAALRGKS